ncbi:MAG: SCO family protein [Acidobacteria bacterium]|nr:SCO family protein [Acidobacteriota bacterium]
MKASHQFRLLVVPLLVLVAIERNAFSQSQLPGPLREVDIIQRLDQPVPLDLEFTDDSGRKVTLAEYFEKRPVLLTLAYFNCPMLCGLQLDGVFSALRVLPFTAGKEFEFVVVSFNPEEGPSEAREKKNLYLKKFGSRAYEKGWHFLTGEEDSIRKLTRAVGFRYSYDPHSGEYAHGTAVYVLTPRGRLARYFYGIEYAPKDLRFSLMQAAEEKIGSLADRLLLFCYHYDPVTGKYGFLILNSIRVAGLATLLALTIFMVSMFRRDRKGTAFSSGGPAKHSGIHPA